MNRDDVPYARYLLDCVDGLQTDDHWPGRPRYCKWHDELYRTFELDDTVKQRILKLIVNAGFDDSLPDDWRLRDLGL